MLRCAARAKSPIASEVAMTASMYSPPGGESAPHKLLTLPVLQAWVFNIMKASTPDVITRYFAAQSARDWDTLIALFADDAVVIDEGRTMRGIREIRSWRRKRRVGL